MNPFIRRIIMELAEKLIKSTFKAYKNVNQRHGTKGTNLFEEFKSHMKANVESRMSIEEATRILNLEAATQGVLYNIEGVF